MAQEYAKVLKGQKVPLLVVGRGEVSAKKFKEDTDLEVIQGGTGYFLEQKPDFPSAAIVSVGIEQLAPVTTQLLNYGVKRILVEKPGGMGRSELSDLMHLALGKEAMVYLAYNRRFFASTIKAIEIIKADGGVTSFCFDFTEWGHIIRNLENAPGVKEKWFLANSTHTVDLAFFLCGFPKEINCYIQGSLAWHPSASIFTGSGISDKNALFTYHANWESPGRWGVEILTSKHRLILRPLEKLLIQEIGSTATTEVEFDSVLDENYKPGLFKQVESFLGNENTHLCTLEEQYSSMAWYYKIANYG